MARAASEMVPGLGDAVNAGEEAVRAVQSGASARDVQRRATGVFAAGLIGGKVGGTALKIARGLLSKPAKASLTDRALSEIIGYGAGQGLTGVMGGTEDKVRPGKPR